MTFDDVTREVAKRFVAALPYPECEICQHCNRTLRHLPDEGDKRFRYEMVVECKRECERER